MKSIGIVFTIFLLMTNCFFINVQATEEVVDTSEIEVIGEVVEAGEVIEKVTGTVNDKVQLVEIKITEGEYKGEKFETEYVLSYDIEGKILAYPLEVGDKVTTHLSIDSEGNVTITVYDVVRSGYIIIMFLLFVVSVIIIGGKRGVKAIVALLLTILAIYFILIKQIFNGSNVITTSIATITITICVTFLVIGGISKKIITASIGTLGGVVSAGIMALIFNRLEKMSGACEDAIQLSINMTNGSFNFRDLLFAGIIVSALGACMDVAMSIASSLDEIKMKNPEITWQELFKSGMNIGKDVIGTMTNTLILAYVGGSLTLILLFMACNMSFIEILNKETIAEQIISAIAGSMGVVYTVPITAFAYSIFNKDKTIYRKVSENKIEGKRSLKI